MPEDLSRLIKKIRKEIPGVRISSIAEVDAPFDLRLPTGIMSLDMRLGGGFPAGSLHQIFGPEGVGKDYLTNLMIAEQQRIHGDAANILWLSFGYKPDKSFWKLCGVREDVGNLLIEDITEKGMNTPAETLLSTMLEFLKSNKFQLIVINELGSGETRANVKKTLGEDAKVATWATLLSEFFKKYYTVMRTPTEDGSPNKTCVMAINPVRANMDMNSAKYNPFTQPNGNALKHAKAVDLHLKVGKGIKKGGKKVGKNINWLISKGKHGISEGAKGSYGFIFGSGVDFVADLVMTAKAAGSIVVSGPVYRILDSSENIKGGLDAVIEIVRADEDLQRRIREDTLAKHKMGVAIDLAPPDDEEEDDVPEATVAEGTEEPTEA